MQKKLKQLMNAPAGKCDQATLKIQNNQPDNHSREKVWKLQLSVLGFIDAL